MALPANFQPMPSSHGVRPFFVDFIELGIPETTLADVLRPEFWAKQGQHFQRGDEIRCRGVGFDANFRVASSGIGGVVLENPADAVSTAPRHLWIARDNGAFDRHMAFWQIGALNADAKWQELSPGLRNLRVLGEVIAEELKRGPFNLTLTLNSIAGVRQDVEAPFVDPKAAFLQARGNRYISVFCPIEAGSHIWTLLSFSNGKVGETSDNRFVHIVLPDRIREAFAFEPYRQRSSTTELWVRPAWVAKDIAGPEYFPPPKSTAVPDRLAYDFRAKKAAEKIPKHKRPNGWAADPNWWVGLDL